MEYSEEEIKAMKESMLELHKKTVKAAYDYFIALPIGDERVIAHEVYQNLLYATRL